MSSAMWYILWGAVIAVLIVAYVVISRRQHNEEKETLEELSTTLADRVFKTDDEEDTDHE